MDPNLAGMAGNVSQMGQSSESRSGQKRKAGNPLDAPGGECSRRYKRLAPMPGPDSRCPGPGHSVGLDIEPETQEASPHQQVLTPMGTAPTIAAGGHLPRSGVLSGSIPVSVNPETQVMDHSVGEEEGLVDLNHRVPDIWMASIDFASQASGFEHSGAQGDLGSIQSQLAFPSDGQLGQRWIQNAGPPLVTCPWRSHLETITSIDLDISELHRKSSITMEPGVKEGLGVLFGHLIELKRSYFILQKSVNLSKLSSQGNLSGWTI